MNRFRHMDTYDWLFWAAIALFFGCVAFSCALAADGDFAYRVKAEKSEGRTSHGTAGAISAHTLVTAAHVIKDADEIFIDHPIGWLRCKVVKSDAETDLAVIECSSVELKFAPIDTTQRISGDLVTVLASMAGAKIKAIAATIRTTWGEHQWGCDAHGFDHGGSGSPVIRESKLVGVATGLEADKHGDAIPNTMVFVAADCIQHVLAAETFQGEKLPAPKTKAEVIELPTVKQSLTTETDRKPTATDRIIIGDLVQNRPQTIQCQSGHCTRIATEHSSRHWDSDIDGHGQGGFTND